MYRRDHCEDGLAADFLVERADGARIVLECRFNTHRDFERAIATAEVLRARLRCAAAWIVVPFDAGDLAAMAAGTGAEVVALGELHVIHGKTEVGKREAFKRLQAQVEKKFRAELR